MARPLSKPSGAQARGAGSALVVPRIGDLRPYLLLALLTLLALMAAYAVRPAVRIDMGGDYDAAFLEGFNSREIDAIGAGEAYPWASGAATLSVPGRRDGVWIATLRAAPGQPAGALDAAAIAVNDIRVDMPRRTLAMVLAQIPPELSGAETLTFSLVSPLVGGAIPPRDLVGEVVLAQARTYRWSTGEAQVRLPGLGRGAWVVSLGAVTAHPDGRPADARLFANDTLLGPLPDSAAPRRLHLLVPAALMRDGGLELTIRATPFVDPRPLGVLLSDITVAPAGGGGLATAMPPLGSLGLGLVIVLGMYATLSLILAAPRPRPAGPPWRSPTLWATLGVAAALLLGAWAIGAHRYPSSFMLPRLAWLALWSILLTLALRPATAWLFRTAGVAADADSGAGGASNAAGASNAPLPFFRILLLIFILSYWLKALGVLFPYFVAIDVHWHMTRASWIIEGQLPLLYGTNSPLNESTMPTAEWGANRPVIPYSPWFHMFATLFAFTPMTMDMAANMFSLLIDSTRVILIALIALRAGLSPRGALIAAATYATLPVAFLLHSWGNIPTTFGLWQILVVQTIIFVWWDRLHERLPMVLLSLAMLVTFLMYTVTGVFLGVFLVVFSALIWLNGMRGGPWAALRRPLGALWTAAGVAIALALLIYYGQYIAPIVERTVPYMSTVFTQGPESVGVERPPFGQYLWGYIPHLDYRIWPGDYLYYGIGIPMLFTIPGYLALRGRPLAWVLCSAWLTVAVLFLFAGYRISMVDKQLFYMLPVMCVCWALCADWLWARWPWGRWLVIAALAYALYAALDQWVLRIATSPVA